MTGPEGTSLRPGAAPRSLGTVLQRRLWLSLSHSQGAPKMPLSAMPGTRRARAVETSTIQRLRPGSRLRSLVLTNMMLRPSGAQLAKRIFAFTGSPLTVVSAPVQVEGRKVPAAAGTIGLRIEAQTAEAQLRLREIGNGGKAGNEFDQQFFLAGGVGGRNLDKRSGQDVYQIDDRFGRPPIVEIGLSQDPCRQHRKEHNEATSEGFERTETRHHFIWPTLRIEIRKSWKRRILPPNEEAAANWNFD